MIGENVGPTNRVEDDRQDGRETAEDPNRSIHGSGEAFACNEAVFDPFRMCSQWKGAEVNWHILGGAIPGNEVANGNWSIELPPGARKRHGPCAWRKANGKQNPQR